VYRYQVVVLPRGDEKVRDDRLWELGRAGWDLVSVLPGSYADPADAGSVTLFLRRAASEDIGV
jgi:hypothetical protein